MPYATLQDVKVLAPNVMINAQSKPSSGTVAEWLGDTDRLVDAILKGIGYETPITGATSLSIVRQIVAHMVMARVMRSRPNPEVDPETFQRWANDIIGRIKSPSDPLTLGDAVAVDVVLKDAGVRVSSNLKDLSLEDPQPFARRDMQF
jgi:hypothetical protein